MQLNSYEAIPQISWSKKRSPDKSVSYVTASAGQKANDSDRLELSRDGRGFSKKKWTTRDACGCFHRSESHQIDRCHKTDFVFYVTTSVLSTDNSLAAPGAGFTKLLHLTKAGRSD